MTRNEDVSERLRTPRAAAVAGIAFALLLSAVMVSLRLGVGDLQTSPQDWVGSGSGRTSVGLAMSLIPFAGIAFLWFVGVIRTRLGDLEDKLFATVLLGSGLLFVAMLFTTAATIGSLLAVTSDGSELSGDSQLLLGTLASQLLGAFGIRMAAVFTLSVTTLGLRTGLIPRWLVFVGYAVPIVLFLTPPITAWAQFLFPLWVLLLSLHILYVSVRPDGSPSH